MKKIISILIIFSVLLLSIAIEISGNTIDILAEQYTENDIYYFNGDSYDIENYPESGDTIDIVGRGIGYGQRNVIYGSSYRYDNNDIVHIIPEELFFSEGIYVYTGKEYGFYINTILLEDGVRYRSNTILYDLEYTIPDVFNEKTDFVIKVISNCIYESWERDSNSYLSNLIIEGKDRVVTFLTTPVQGVNHLTLSDISVEVEIENRDNLNPGDNGYELMNNYTSEIIDKGDYVVSQKLKIQPNIMPNYANNELTDKEELIYYYCKKIIKETKVLSPLLLLENIDESFAKLSDPDSNGMYTTYYSEYKYESGQNQVYTNEQYVRTAKCCTNTSLNYNPHLDDGDFCEVNTLFAASLEKEDRWAMNLKYNVTININDNEYEDEITHSFSREFAYSRKWNVCYENNTYQFNIDGDIGKIAMYFYSDDIRKIRFYVSSNNVKTSIYNSNGIFISSGYGSVILESPEIEKYVIIIEGEILGNLSFSPIKFTEHIKTYEWLNLTAHNKICLCGEIVQEGHVVSSEAFNSGSSLAPCLLCGGNASIGFIEIQNKKIKITINGSFILNNGLIVLVDTDIESYFDGTLEFNDIGNEVS